MCCIIMCIQVLTHLCPIVAKVTVCFKGYLNLMEFCLKTLLLEILMCRATFDTVHQLQERLGRDLTTDFQI